MNTLKNQTNSKVFASDGHTLYQGSLPHQVTDETTEAKQN